MVPHACVQSHMNKQAAAQGWSTVNQQADIFFGGHQFQRLKCLKNSVTRLLKICYFSMLTIGISDMLVKQKCDTQIIILDLLKW